jgi:lipid-binding SYLF domain-containing protein
MGAHMKLQKQTIPTLLLALSRAKAVAVFPSVIKVALSFGGEAGRGVVSRHTDGPFPDALSRYTVNSTSDR